MIIPAGVTEIKKYAFKDCTSLVSVRIPESVTQIEEGAFNGCVGLRSLRIPEGVVQIGDGAFFGCSQLNITLLSDLIIDLSYVEAVFAKKPKPLKAEFPNKKVFSLNDMYYSPGRTLK